MYDICLMNKPPDGSSLESRHEPVATPHRNSMINTVRRYSVA